MNLYRRSADDFFESWNLHWDIDTPWWGRREYSDYFHAINTCWAFGPFYLVRTFNCDHTETCPSLAAHLASRRSSAPTPDSPRPGQGDKSA